MSEVERHQKGMNRMIHKRENRIPPSDIELCWAEMEICSCECEFFWQYAIAKYPSWDEKDQKWKEKKIWIQLPSAIVLICTFPNCLIRLWAKWKSSEVKQRKFYFNLIKQIPVESSWTAHIQNNIEAREDQTFSFAHQYTTLWCIALNVHVGCCYYEML